MTQPPPSRAKPAKVAHLDETLSRDDEVQQVTILPLALE
jgi:hypothetical protein